MTRRSWFVKVPGYPVFQMGGEDMTYEQALYAARLIWPKVDVEVY